ncbi:hypothetical protein C0J45_11902 [Silurus meridionalis]|nr:hypothetical protein C0J45_11902 [Silurus meridionalis]
MNSKRVQSFVDPLPQGKRARLEDTVSTSGLSKVNSLPQYSQDESLPYRHTYMSCTLGGQESLDLPSTWSPSRIFVRNGGSPVVHASATEGSLTNQVIYRPENMNYPEDNGSPTVAAKQKFGYSTRSLSKQSPSSAGLMSPVPFRKVPVGCTSLSPSTAEKSGGLAIPKPVYGHGPCCASQKCIVGHGYRMDQGLQRVPPQVFDDDRISYYGHWTCMNKKESEALMQQRLLPFEHCGERASLKDVTTDGYHSLSPSVPERFSAFSDPRHSNYIYNHAHPIVLSSPDHCQRFQMPRQAHKDRTPMYEQMPEVQYGTHMQIYQDGCPHPSKYRDIPQHSLLYCPKNNIDVYKPDNSQQTSGQHPILHNFFRDFRNPYTVVPPGHPAVRNVPADPACRTHLNRQMNPFNKRQFCPPVMQQIEQPLDFSIRREQNAVANQELPSQSQLGNKGTLHQNNPQAHYLVSNNLHLQNSSIQCRGQDNCLINSHNYTASPPFTRDIFSKNQSLCFLDKPGSGAVLSKKHIVEPDKSHENDSLAKVKMLQLNAKEINHPSSPPMPVINKVFSLAPYKAYLEATGVLSPAQDLSSPMLAPDSKPTKDEPEVQNIDCKKNLDIDVLRLKLKKEKIEPEENACQSGKESHSPVNSENDQNVGVKKEQDHLELTEGDTAIKNALYSDSKPIATETLDSNITCSVMDGVAMQTQNGDQMQSDFLSRLSGKSQSPTLTDQVTFSQNKIPPHCLKLTSFKIILPDIFKTPVSPVPEVLHSPVENKVAISSRQARYEFMEFHQSLCRLISGCISQTSNCELRNWLSRLDPDESASHSAKTQKVSCLLGSKSREVWMKNEETARALQKVLYQLRNYVRIQECPFPHVIRAGAVFIPMLVVKELLFPQVQGTFIDQVLQEHRVELRPTTLSEERQLTQLHRRAFSSKLRRLLSLKHLPDIYPDILNLLYYADVCKVLGIEVNGLLKKECMQCSDELQSSFNGFEMHCISPSPHMPDTEDLKQTSCQKNLRTKGRVKGACKRRFLGDDTSSEEDGPAEESETWTFTSCLEVESWENVSAACTNVEAHIEVKIESDAEQGPENSWGRPLTSDDLSSESTDVDTEMTPLSSYERHAPISTRRRSDMVLKLKKVYHTKGRRGQVSHYQRVPDQSEVQRRRHRRYHRKKKHRSSKSNIRHRLRKFSSRSKLCPYLSTQCTSENRRRWVLRSAVQNSHQAIRNSYPDLVGKRIRHLYEENDKTEVWYKGVVLRIHESHPNPLKTVFEVKYDSEPEWQYYLELLVDYKKGWLEIEA